MCTELEKALENIRETAEVIYDHGWGEASAGNLSIRLIDQIQSNKQHYTELNDRFENLSEKTIVITSSGSRMRHIASQSPDEHCSIITLNETGTGYFRSEKFCKEPSSELTAHLMLHNEYARKNNGIKAVLHCHPDEIIMLLHMTGFKTKEAINKMLFTMHTEAELIIPEGVGLLGVKKPGSYEFASAVLNELKSRDIALIEKHGCISVGTDLNDALDKIEFVNKAARIYLGINR